MGYNEGYLSFIGVFIRVTFVYLINSDESVTNKGHQIRREFSSQIVYNRPPQLIMI